MINTSVISNNIDAIGYDKENCVLQVEFKSGSIYEYYDVPESTHEQLMSASSHGKFLNSDIKPNFTYKEL